MKNYSSGHKILLIMLLMVCGGVGAVMLDGRATLSGEVLASACSIALNDRFQTVRMGEMALRDFRSGHGRNTQDFVIHLDNCVMSGGIGKNAQALDPAIRIRFDGVQGAEPWFFAPTGLAQGVAVVLRDERRELVHPGKYLPAVYQKAYDQQVLKYRIEIVPDGKPLLLGDYYTSLRFNIDYE
ncbi:type 1 fimbrial protein [Salmonella enterica]|nr:type 1 fimbrial protein [Salmonella enterica]